MNVYRYSYRVITMRFNCVDLYRASQYLSYLSTVYREQGTVTGNVFIYLFPDPARMGNRFYPGFTVICFRFRKNGFSGWGTVKPPPKFRVYL